MKIPESDMVPHEVVLLIPAYNEGSAIKKTIDAIPKKFTKIICVDDGSSDDTAKQAKLTRATVLSHCINLGQGAALQTAIDFALTDPVNKYFVTFDADGQHDIADVETMLKEIKAKKLDIILGSRFLGKTVNMDAKKRSTLKLAIWFSNMVSGLKLSDTHNGLRVMNRHAASLMQLKMSDFAHASEILERIKQKNLSFTEVPVTISYSEYSRGKGQSIINAVNIAFDLILYKIAGKK